MPLLSIQELQSRGGVVKGLVSSGPPIDVWAGWGVQRKPDGCKPCLQAAFGLSFVPDEYPTNPKIAVMLEAPGADEAVECRPLVGKSGQLFMWELIGKLGYKRSDVLIANTTRCRGPQNVYPIGKIRVSAEKCCRQYDHISRRDGETLYAGIAEWNPNLFLVTFHPAAILRTRALMRLVRKDMEKAFNFAAEGYRPVMLMGDKALNLLAPWTRGKGGVKAWRGHYWEASWPKFVLPSEFEDYQQVEEDSTIPF